MDSRIAVRFGLYQLALIVGFVVTGCATDPSPKFKDDIDSLKRQVWNLEKQTAEVNLRLAQNSNEVSLLGEKVKRLEDAVNGLKEAIIRSSGQKAGYPAGFEPIDAARHKRQQASFSSGDLQRN